MADLSFSFVRVYFTDSASWIHARRMFFSLQLFVYDPQLYEYHMLPHRCLFNLLLRLFFLHLPISLCRSREQYAAQA